MTIVFLHGYSVTGFDTYGSLPARITNEAIARGINVNVQDIFLGRYITFSDHVMLADLARAMEHAVSEQLGNRDNFVLISHSTGGPLVRTWLDEFYYKRGRKSQMSHLIMLAPANHGSALAQLGKSKLSRLRSWFEGLEPGQGVLSWLELGSNDSWRLNKKWIFESKEIQQKTGVFLFVVTGQDIDRKMFDHINSYTGEDGSDGVVRVASANLNSAFLSLCQKSVQKGNKGPVADELELEEFREADPIPLRILRVVSHSGDRMGIMRSVNPQPGNAVGAELVHVVFECIAVTSNSQQEDLFRKFANENAQVQAELRVEEVENTFRNKIYFHDRHSMVFFRVSDTEGNPVDDFDLVITGDDDDPDQLPTGFFADRQCNRVNRNTLCYYFNYDIMTGNAEIRGKNGEILRPKNIALKKLGLKIIARPDSGFVRYLPCRISGSQELFEKVIRPNASTLVEIRLQRVLSDQNFRFEEFDPATSAKLSFKNTRPGDGFVV